MVIPKVGIAAIPAEGRACWEKNTHGVCEGRFWSREDTFPQVMDFCVAEEPLRWESGLYCRGVWEHYASPMPFPTSLPGKNLTELGKVRPIARYTGRPPPRLQLLSKVLKGRQPSKAVSRLILSNSGGGKGESLLGYTVGSGVAWVTGHPVSK